MGIDEFGISVSISGDTGGRTAGAGPQYLGSTRLAAVALRSDPGRRREEPYTYVSVSRKPGLHLGGMCNQALKRMTVVPLAGNRKLRGLNISSPRQRP